MFITFEGIEGSGKSSLMERLAARLEESGHAVRLTREPGGSRLGRQLRKILLDIENTDLTSQAELFLYLADRAQHVAQVIRPALNAGQIVLCDRYADSTVVYQGYGRGLDVDRLQAFNDMAVDGLWPDLSLLLDLHVETGLSRALGRNDELGQSEKEGRFEAESLEFHTRVRQGYLDWAARNAQRFRTVDASRTQDQVFQDAWALVKPLLDRP